MNKKINHYLSTVGRYSLLLCILCASAYVSAEGNKKMTSFVHSIRTLLQQVYVDQRFTFYCGAYFDVDENISLPKGFTVPNYFKVKAKHVEWDHIVPTERFGRKFEEWTKGSPKCVTNDGTPFYGKKCALVASREYQYMHADMYNLAPSMGVINDAKQDYPFTMLSKNHKSQFGTCDMVVYKKKVQPPKRARGPIARTFLYMDLVYPQFSMAETERSVMKKWNEMYPADKFECMRYRRIQTIQGNANPIVTERCKDIKEQEEQRSAQ